MVINRAMVEGDCRMGLEDRSDRGPNRDLVVVSVVSDVALVVVVAVVEAAVGFGDALGLDLTLLAARLRDDEGGGIYSGISGQ